MKTLAGFTQSSQARPTAQRQLAAAATALSTALVYPPLRIVCGPALLYLGAATAQRGYCRWQQGEPVSAAVVEGAIVVIGLAQGSFLVGALGFTCYYLGQAVFDSVGWFDWCGCNGRALINPVPFAIFLSNVKRT